MNAGAPPPDRGLSRAELSNRVARSIAASSAWGFSSLLIGFFGNLVLARLLTPRDFGIVAIGSTVLLAASAIGDAGLGAGMIRWPREPTRVELARLTGAQLLITMTLACVVGAVALSFGSSGDVVAVMLLAMPLMALQAPGRILFMRSVRYGAISAVDGIATIVFYGWSIAGAALGFGVWGLATGTVVRAVVGTVLIWIASEVGAVRPAFRNLTSLGPLFAYGVRFQATWLVVVVRDILVNIVTGAVGGVQALGLWSLGRRVMEVPLVLVSTLLRVGFPAMAHLLTSGEKPAPVIERAGRVVAVVSALGLAAFAGLVPALVPGLFGEGWERVANVVAWASVAVLATLALSVVPAGYLQAANRPQATAWAAGAGAVVWIAATATLLGVVGVAAVGIGWVLGSLTEGALLAMATARACGARVAAEVGVPLLTGVVGCTVGAVLSLSLEPGIVTALAAAAGAVATTAVGLAVLSHRSLTDAFVQVRDMAVRVIAPRAT